MRLKDKVALVTGGSRGIGQAIALGYAFEGAKVVVNYVNHRDDADMVVAKIVDGGGDAIAIQADVAAAADCDRLVGETIARYGSLDLLVNNAGGGGGHQFNPWHEATVEDWDYTYALNVRSQFLLARAAYPSMKAKGWGRIINVSSVQFWLGMARSPAYVAAKGAVIGFTRSLARNVGEDGITVNAITPGAIRTLSELDLFPDQEAVYQQMMSLQSLKRRGLPEDIVGVAVFLATDEASFITGQTINVDGGWAMH